MKKQYPLLIAAFVLGFKVGKDRRLFTNGKWARHQRFRIVNATFDTALDYLLDHGFSYGEALEHMLDFEGYLAHNLR